MKRLHGVVCATITPMYPNGDVDIESAKSLYRYLAQEGIHCLYPNGTNGESLSLVEDERRELAQAAVDEAGEKQVVYIQCGASTPAESYRHVHHAKEIGADGAGLMTPVFFSLDEAALEQYYASILDEIGDFPMYVYNIASRTGNDVSAALLGRLMDRYPSLHGIKFSAPDLLRVKAYVHAPKNRRADVLIGCDPLAMCCMISGGTGWVSGPGAVFSKAFVSLYDQIMRGEMQAAQETQERITAFMSRLSGIPEIPAIKYMLKKMGVIRCDTVRRPLRPLTDAEKQMLDLLMQEMQI
ncbi:MAG: dihydrodipicolinate synthase family protein [Clostridia bacterium]|nr:dihydrodipicolinate synthase family protein [Clostridia bacterium]